MLFDPFGQPITLEMPGCKPKHELFLLIHGCAEFVPVQEQEHLHRCVPNPFVAVDEGMITVL
jgi:hypothetical protein